MYNIQYDRKYANRAVVAALGTTSGAAAATGHSGHTRLRPEALRFRQRRRALALGLRDLLRRAR
eukprot:9081752-Pyramimonas_sp.AAC.1